MCLSFSDWLATSLGEYLSGTRHLLKFRPPLAACKIRSLPCPLCLLFVACGHLTLLHPQCHAVNSAVHAPPSATQKSRTMLGSENKAIPPRMGKTYSNVGLFPLPITQPLLHATCRNGRTGTPPPSRPCPAVDVPACLPCRAASALCLGTALRMCCCASCFRLLCYEGFEYRNEPSAGGVCVGCAYPIT